MFLPTETNFFLKVQNLPICMNGSGFLLSKKVLCKSSHRGCYREGLHGQDDFTGDGGHGTTLQAEVSPDETEFCIKPQRFRARG